MAYTTINKHTDYFNTKLYTGTASSSGDTQAVTGVGFQPDWVWIKNRSGAYQHVLYDAVRGVNKEIRTAENSAEFTSGTNGYLSAFDSDGFTTTRGTNTGNHVNVSGSNFVSWNWKAGGGQGSSNTDGSINTTYTSVNTTAGFSISSYTGTGSNATVGHGLGAVPKMIIVKCLNDAQNWFVYHESIGATQLIRLNSNAAKLSSSTSWNNTAPTNSVFSVGTESGTNQNGNLYIAYCFAEKTGYSKFGSYTGNNSSDGTFVYTGFKPEFIIVKPSNYADNWHMIDDKRNTFNPMDTHLFPNLNNADSTATSYVFDMLSNGFKPRSNNTAFNGSYNYIYMAFGQSLVGSNNVPCTAR